MNTRMVELPREIIEKILDYSDIDTRRAFHYYRKLELTHYQHLLDHRPMSEHVRLGSFIDHFVRLHIAPSKWYRIALIEESYGNLLEEVVFHDLSELNGEIILWAALSHVTPLKNCQWFKKKNKGKNKWKTIDVVPSAKPMS